MQGLTRGNWEWQRKLKLLCRLQGLEFGDFTPKMDSQMEQSMI